MAVGEVLGPVCFQPIGPDLWSLFTNHGGGNSRFGPRIPNRMFVFRVREAGGKSHLVAFNVVQPDLEADQPFLALRELSAELGAPLRAILNPGPEHHLSLIPYAEAFPDVPIYVAAGRIERENPTLCALPNVERLGEGDALPELGRMGLHVHVWGGFMEGKLVNRTQLRFGARRGTAEPLLVWHEASGAFINGGHGWFSWPVGAKPLPWPASRMLKLREGHVTWSPVHYSVHDHARAAAGAQRTLDWNFEHILDLHVPLDRHLWGRGHAVAESLMRPLIEGDWDSLPFGREALEIPEGFITGGTWKSYRKALRGSASSV
ncbi:hypothetical protein PPSIR1_32183 [Plesiocystis pacifica SIR-1]|uniref:Uncharacterized protein n=2 Tax=Plesiocystis pacifica TaxID=191768 RepID=A6G304_9BACT|nr:hypothetical protein PPSIR1_32183 [Plesiocystis pacifica SIR-1]